MTMNTQEDNKFRYSVGRAIPLWLAVLGSSFYCFAPFLLGTFIGEGYVTSSEAGWIASINMLGSCVALLVYSLPGMGSSFKVTALIALVMMTIGNLATIFSSNFLLLAVTRAATGFGEGAAIAAAIKILKQDKGADRAFAMLILGMSVYGVVGLLVIPVIIARLGATYAYLLLALLPFVSLWFVCFNNPLTAASQPEIRQPAARSGIATPAILLLVSIALVYVGTNGLWAYFERLGTHAGLTQNQIGMSLSGALFSSVLGSLAAAVMGVRFGRILPITFGLVLCCLSSVLLFHTNLYTYVASATLLFGGTGFIFAYYMGLLIALDASSAAPNLAMLWIFLGNLVGPGLLGQLTRENNYSLLYTGALAAFLTALLLVLISKLLSGRTLTLAALKTP